MQREGWRKATNAQRNTWHAEAARQLSAEKEAALARIGEADERRARHEAHWLNVERNKYGPTKQFKPLSRQPA